MQSVAKSCFVYVTKLHYSAVFFVRLSHLVITSPRVTFPTNYEDIVAQSNTPHDYLRNWHSTQSSHTVAYIDEERIVHCIVFTLPRYKNTNEKRTYVDEPLSSRLTRSKLIMDYKYVYARVYIIHKLSVQ
ncbi:hypothetical protein PUN28_003290 [Cardiocondyla obscurior]|uniref:Uncharacterized protein n=1 Tax=Cardiocondyla obscurior TaxID=286306 RepID=A0AAW2GL86_9HYME